MQSQINNNTPVHVKVAINGEFRRFLLNPLTFANLETTVKTLFTISAPVSLKFQDDEKDWVHLTTDAELLYAIELAGSPLRLDAKILAEVPSLRQTPAVHEETVQEGCWRGRGGKRGRGGCGGRGGNVAERFEMTETRLRTRLAELQEKLDSGKLTSERERTVGWKITRLQEKLEFVAAKRASLEIAKSENPTEEKTCEVTEVTDQQETPREEEKWGRRGGRGCRGRRGGLGGEGCWGKKPKGCFKNRLSPEILENFHQCKTAWKAAKDSGDAEQIASCKEAFWAAKDAKRAAMIALRTQDAGEEQENKAGSA